MKREYKTFQFQLKAANDEEGTIEGYLSVFNNVDLGNDRVIKGAFKQTLKLHKASAQKNNSAYIFPMLWQHDPNQPIGGVTDAREDEYGLFTKAQFDLDTQRGKEAYSGYKKGYLNQLSIGYDVIKKSYDDKGVRNLEELRLWEQSTVTFAMNEEALVTGVKAGKAMDKKQKKDFSDEYQRRQLSSWQDDFYNLTGALRSAVMDAMKDDDPMESTMSAVQGDEDGPGFVQALQEHVQRGIDLGYPEYLNSMQQESGPNYYGIMSSDSTPARKAGRAISATNAQTIQDHIDNLRTLANDHKKALHSAADDLATVLQGSEPAYTTDHGTPEKSRPSDQHLGKNQPSSADTDLETAMSQLVAIRTLKP